jgi:hypothetical protein
MRGHDAKKNPRKRNLEKQKDEKMLKKKVPGSFTWVKVSLVVPSGF